MTSLIHSSKRELGLGLLGFGNVGQAVADILKSEADNLAKRLGASLVLRQVAVKDLKKLRPQSNLPAEIFTDSFADVVKNPAVDIVAEVMGGVDTARYAIIEALDQGKQVVTANKALIATHGQELIERAHAKQRDLLFEASACGGIPVLRVLREAYVGNRINSVVGILNGTCNFILTEMQAAARRGQSDYAMSDALKIAQTRGYAEQDPTMDLDGTDAVQKLAILASLALGTWIDYKSIYREGITALRVIDFEMAEFFGYRIKLLGIAREQGGNLQIRVHPAFIRAHNPLASVEGVFNAVSVDGQPLGPSLLYGLGAGGGPTASAVLADVVDAGRNLLASSAGRVPVLSYPASDLRRVQIVSIDDLVAPYYLRLTVVDRPGALAAITQVLGKHQISIASLIQRERGPTAPIPVVLVTHEVLEKNVRKALNEIDQLEVVVDRSVLIRIEASFESA